jgi:hypothetical protein
MPGGDGTGPVGAGPMSGRAAGFCAGFGTPGCANPAGGFGGRHGRFGAGAGGRGRGRGFRWRYLATGIPGRAWYGGGAPQAAPVDEAATLRRQAEFLEASLGEIRSRIGELEAAAKKEP